MRTPSSEDLLTTWERGRAEPHAVGRALVLLSAFYPDAAFDSLADLTIGQRDSLLLAGRTRLFGPQLRGLTACPRCHQSLEFDFEVTDILADTQSATPPIAIARDDYAVEFRLPTSGDLLALSTSGGNAERRLGLLKRTFRRASRADAGVEFEQLPAQVLDEVEQAMQDADVQADITLRVTCRACAHEFSCVFDIVSFLWSELEAWAIRLLRDVHTLARSYGWSEADILRMRPWRRQCYLEMLGA
jgi:hypothetical protein